MSVSVHIDNKEKDNLILGKGPKAMIRLYHIITRSITSY